ncbi:MAG: MarR family winged helix-turn-helix transcriptional regulator [Deltaproteobacteria bacterium]|nr:MarR family winged helix-turn-helix transcriptional regulator [Deltaproteobacteria bacterium]
MNSPLKQDDQKERMDCIDMDLARDMGRTCVCFNMRKATRFITQFYDRSLRSTGLRVTQLTLMTAIRVLGPTSFKRLSEAVGMDQTTLSRNVSLLEKKGLVELESGEDHRARKISLTRLGHEALKQAYPLWKAAQAEMVSKIGSGNWTSVLESMSLMMRK